MLSLNKEQLDQLFGIVGKTVPKDIVSEDITEILIEIEKKISPEYAKTQTKFLNNASILLVDDRELSIYQLSRLLVSCGYTVSIARSVEEALDFYKKQSFQYAVIDLFLPNPEDGLSLIDTINNSEKTKTDETKIIVISGSDDKKLINECFVKGANEFIGKFPDWHKKLLHHIGNLEVQKYGGIDNVHTEIKDSENKIASISVSNLYKEELIETLKREIQILVNTGYVNIIINLEKVKKIDSAGLNAIVYAYKSCTESKGILKLCGVNNTVKEALSYVFLDNLIFMFKDTDSALFDYKKENSLNS